MKGTEIEKSNSILIKVTAKTSLISLTKHSDDKMTNKKSKSSTQVSNHTTNSSKKTQGVSKSKFPWAVRKLLSNDETRNSKEQIDTALDITNISTRKDLKLPKSKYTYL